MGDKKLDYKGRKIEIKEKDDKASITIDGKYRFDARQHSRDFPAWMCGGAYYMAPDTAGLARHLVDNLAILTAPTTAPFEGMTVIDGSARSPGSEKKK